MFFVFASLLLHLMNNQLIGVEYQSDGSQGSSYHFESQQSSTFGSKKMHHEEKLAITAKFAGVLEVGME